MTRTRDHAPDAPLASDPEPSLAKRILGFAYGAICYAIFFATFLYAAGWVGNIFVPKSLDGEPVAGFVPSLLVNLGLLSVFAVQHSVMARPAFKRWFTRFVPRPLERSTYVLLSSLALILLFWQWRPLGGVIWDIQALAAKVIMYAVFGAGWLLVLVSTFLINHFDLFGLRQVWRYLRGRKYTPLAFRTPSLYRYVRHPLYLGWLMAFWATPTMTGAHLLFAAITTSYIFVAIQLEERDLVDAHGLDYADYRRRVPMIFPFLKRKPRPLTAPARAA
jgi:protein-S-isoprenylcysteine O-methyltransferase Ste14